MDKKLTIVVPAYNEERNLEKTVKEAYSCATKFLDAFEVIIVDDGSSDRTGQIADALAHEFSPAVKAVHFQQNRGVGAAYLEALRMARYPYVTLVPGDNAFNKSGIERVFSRVGRCDLIVSYRTNPEARTTVRRWLSVLATLLMQGLTGRRIRDAHSLYVFPVELASKIDVPAGYSYHLESLCRLLLMAESYIEIPVELNPKRDQSSGVMKPRTLLQLAGTVLKLYALRITGRLIDKR